jgi:hypothetical protein
VNNDLNDCPIAVGIGDVVECATSLIHNMSETKVALPAVVEICLLVCPTLPAWRVFISTPTAMG